jgi:hypothetical protein
VLWPGTARPGTGAAFGVAVLGAGAFLQPGAHPSLDLLLALVRVLAREALTHEIHTGLEQIEGDLDLLAEEVVQALEVYQRRRASAAGG